MLLVQLVGLTPVPVVLLHCVWVLHARTHFPAVHVVSVGQACAQPVHTPPGWARSHVPDGQSASLRHCTFA